MEAQKVFEGVKVAEFAWAVSGPLLIKYLSDHGAQVVHVESSTALDLLRSTLLES